VLELLGMGKWRVLPMDDYLEATQSGREHLPAISGKKQIE
jgi:hypothetical protein